jgi:ATP-dependent Clp protease ATP-binding subunit ClpC
MFEKFTGQARQVVVLAQEEARLLKHNYIGTEHLLLGVLAQLRDTGAAGLTREQVREQIETSIGRGHGPASGHVPFTPRAKKSLEQAMRESIKLGEAMIGPDHLLLGVLRQTDGAAVQMITELGGDPEEIRRRVLAAHTPSAGGETGQPSAGGETGQVETTRVTTTQVGTGAPAMPAPAPLRAGARAQIVLARYTRSLNEAARAGILDPVAGRDAEIGRLTQVLSRRARNNAILVGEPGAGRHAIAMGLAQRLAGGPLAGRKLYEVEFELLAIGADSRAEAESRATALLAALAGAIIVTDELQPFEGLPDDRGPLLAGFLRAALERRELQLITTATPGSYRALIERDPRLTLVAQAVEVPTPSTAAATEMLAATRSRFEEHHDVRIDDAAMALAATLASEHLGTLPAAATDLLDEACAGAAGTDRVVAEADIRAALKRLRAV